MLSIEIVWNRNIIVFAQKNKKKNLNVYAKTYFVNFYVHHSDHMSTTQ